MPNNLSANINMRRNNKIKLVAPVFIGILVGLIFSIFYEPFAENAPLCPQSKAAAAKVSTQQKRADKIPSETKPPIPVKAKASHFNHDFRPYFVYSELGFRYQIVVGILTTESKLRSFATAINNTWLQDLQKVVFFTPYSKRDDFHQIYNTQLNLNVIQLPDIIENESTSVEFSYRILQYMKEHFVNTYSWFMLVNDDVYINAVNLQKFLYAFNSTKDEYLGRSMQAENSEPYCYGKTGIILSRTAMLKLSFKAPSNNYDFGYNLGKTILKQLGIDCMHNWKIQDLFLVRDAKTSLKELKTLKSIITLWPVSSPRQLIEIHEKVTAWKLRENFKQMHKLQSYVMNIVTKLPNDVPEKTLSWPIGFPPPFQPSSRYEVIEWTYFDCKKLFGVTEAEPVSTYSKAYEKDLNDIKGIMKDVNAGQSEDFCKQMKNGYRRLDPQRGAEYIIDFAKKSDAVERVHVIRPLSKIEALSMPAATEQKGIHLVLPVLKEDVGLFESFLQMYKRVCLQTGENVVLLTVFINVKAGRFEGDEKDDPFSESKNLIARYKHSYMWAQLPWLQVGVKQAASVLIMDIVSMKLPSNALIFLLKLNAEFTINFLNRCRVNVVNGMQVFFPIPFSEYDPNIVYENRQKPTFVNVHKDNGFWDRTSNHLACFNNNDYKLLRMYNTDFLDENISVDEKMIDLFQKSNLQIFRAVDSELRLRFTETKCVNASQESCTAANACRKASKSQLSQYLFKQEKLTTKSV